MRKRHNRGFTLVEMIVSIALLAMIALFMLPMVTQSVQFSKWNNIKLTATNMAYTQLEWIKTLDYKTQLGIEGGPSPIGIVKADEYLNNGDKKTIEGVEYTFDTDITWQSAVDSTGTTVARATKKVEVTVTARDPISGASRSFSAIGSLVAFEGERTPTRPLKVIVKTGAGFNDPAVDATVRLKNMSNTLVDFGRTNAEGILDFVEVDMEDFYITAEKDGMITRPTGVIGAAPNQDWSYSDKVNSTAVEKRLFLDRPGNITISSYATQTWWNTFSTSSRIVITPVYTLSEGETAPVITTTLSGLPGKKFWRQWDYKTEVTNGSDKYYLVGTGASNNMLWSKFSIPDYSADTTNDLKLGIGLESGTITKIKDGWLFPDYHVVININFSAAVTGITNMQFTLSNGINNNTARKTISGSGKSYSIRFNDVGNVSVDNQKFTITMNANAPVTSNGISLANGKNEITLVKQ